MTDTKYTLAEQVPLDMWEKYQPEGIYQPGSALPPINYVNISLNDQIFAGNKTFCPDGTDPNATCPSVERRSIGAISR